MRLATKLTLLAGLGLAAFGCRSAQPSPPPGPDTQTTSAATPREATADQPAPLLPDPQMTPGATLPVTRDDICVPGYAKKVRNVPIDLKRQAYAEYGITHHRAGDYEVDHLISLELGGSNSLKNLWPQSFLTQPWNAHVKDQLENELHDEVCRGQIPLAVAQHDIATDWIAAYKKYFGTNRPLSDSGSADSVRRGGRHPLTGGFSQFPAPPASSPPSSANAFTGNAQVWVNLKSGKYFRPGAPYYGHTRIGQYMSEADAQRQGYIAARGH